MGKTLKELTLLDKFLFDQTMDILADGGMRIFLNTKGTNDDEVSPELVDFLHYVETMDEKLAAVPENERVRKIHECVNRIKSSEEMGVKYMQSWEEKIMEHQDGKAEGKAEAILDLLMELGLVSDTLRDTIMSQKDLKILRVWLKAAANAKDIETFQKEIGI